MMMMEYDDEDEDDIDDDDVDDDDGYDDDDDDRYLMFTVESLWLHVWRRRGCTKCCGYSYW